MASWRLLACVGVLSAASVHAHGGLMETQSYTQRRGHPEDQLMSITRGTLISRDGGGSWRWVCAEAMGYGGWVPESYAWLPGGDILTATGKVLLRSRDGGCSWAPSPAFGDAWVTSLAEHPTDDRLLYVATGRPSVTNLLYRSEDGGETWTPTALKRDAVFSSVRVAPSDPKRLYVGGWVDYAMYLFRSDDAGETWQDLPQSFPWWLEGAFDLKLLSVSPANPDVLWVRVSSRGTAGNILYTVLRSDDGGRTLTSVLEQDDPLVNMDVSADGRTTWVATYNHFYRGREGESFLSLPLPTGNACVTRVGGSLYACGSTWLHEWALARSSDEGTSWEPLFSLRDVQGVHQCPAGTLVREQCSSLWPQLAQQLGAPLTPVQPDAGTPDEETPPKPEGCGAAAGSAGMAPLLLLALLRRSARRAEGMPRPR
ncbi:hypothetical protein [Vitiosangium sp. GDMCC 1.1324]|uniref:WD40/YVTN/BNR-like repeat-containing protein n=1 Tax=Vitiosangium sp. (strain GDMCC 1.1324) TaxID=2138576 RepID=UPI000D3BC039|nr:hypothetical protein [Vitiosangium sp. GDMCC 1.1324]PTL77395.1 hypothetical protein DAT35_44080 [Vitiosangium sp. GDMCC 1.1324]